MQKYSKYRRIFLVSQIFELFAFNIVNSLLSAYRKIQNINPRLIEVRKHFFRACNRGAYIRWGAYIRRAFCVSVRVLRPQNASLYIAIIGKKGVSLGQKHLYFALKPI